MDYRPQTLGLELRQDVEERPRAMINIDQEAFAKVAVSEAERLRKLEQDESAKLSRAATILPMRDYSCDPIEKPVFVDQRSIGNVWWLVTAIHAVFGIIAGATLEVFVRGVFVVVVQDPELRERYCEGNGAIRECRSFVLDEPHIYVFMAVSMLLSLYRRYSLTQLGLHVYKDRIRLFYRDPSRFADIYYDDIHFIHQVGTCIRLKARTLVRISETYRSTDWKIVQKMPLANNNIAMGARRTKRSGAGADDQTPHHRQTRPTTSIDLSTYSISVYTGNVERVMRLLLKHGRLRDQTKYELQPQHLAPMHPSKVESSRMECDSSLSGVSYWIRRSLLILLTLAVTHYLYAAIRRFFDLYFGRRNLYSTNCFFVYYPELSQDGTPLNPLPARCAWFGTDYYYYCVALIVLIHSVLFFALSRAKRLIIMDDRICITLSKGCFIQLMLSDLRRIRWCLPDPFVLSGALLLDTVAYTFVKYDEKWKRSTVAIRKTKFPYDEDMYLQLRDSTGHPMLRLRRHHREAFRVVLEDIEADQCDARTKAVGKKGFVFDVKTHTDTTCCCFNPSSWHQFHMYLVTTWWYSLAMYTRRQWHKFAETTKQKYKEYKVNLAARRAGREELRRIAKEKRAAEEAQKKIELLNAERDEAARRTAEKEVRQAAEKKEKASQEGFPMEELEYDAQYGRYVAPEEDPAQMIAKGGNAKITFGPQP